MDEQEKKIFDKMQISCLYFIKHVWGLVPQPLKEEYKARFTLGLGYHYH